MNQKSIGIVGGGLAGMSAAFFLKQKGLNATILEARDRLGGRIYTQYSDLEAPVELGATWLGKKHKHLLELLSELGIGIYEQYMGEYAVYDPISTSPAQIVQMPFNPDPTFRIKNGSSELINQLSKLIDPNSIYLNSTVISVKSHENKLVVETEKQTFVFDKLIITLPPKLFLDSIKFTPSLPEELKEIGQKTHTWMSESIKVALTYERPFWKTAQPIGSIFSNTGLVSEMYDHCNFEASRFALKGFINGGYAFTTKEERKKRVLQQLAVYFGSQVENYISYHEKIWRNEKYTHSDYDGFILPHQNNGHPVFQTQLMNGNLFIAGSETASEHPGYMDGAVESGKIIALKIIKALA
jgi:monoamine oxidase